MGTLGFGAFIAFPSDSMGSAAYARLLSWMPEVAWAYLFMLTGLLHVTALGINGRRWWTPFVRALVTGCNAMVYACFALGFLLINAGSTAVYVYAWLCVCALICFWGAMRDVGDVLEAWNGELE